MNTPHQRAIRSHAPAAKRRRNVPIRGRGFPRRLGLTPRIAFILVATAIAYAIYFIRPSVSNADRSGTAIDLVGRGPAEITLIVVLAAGALAVLGALAWGIKNSGRTTPVDFDKPQTDRHRKGMR